ncbi:MAG: AI-2E family transporter, partial [Acidobacteriota bacterium]
TYWQELTARIEARWPAVVEWWQVSPYREQIQIAVSDSSGSLVEGGRLIVSRIFSAGASVVSSAVALLGWVVLPVYFAYFLVADPPGPNKLESMLPFLKAETRQDVVYLAREFVNIIVAFFRGQLIIAFLQGLIFALGFWLVGLKYGFVIGLALGFLNIVPYLGNIVGLGVALPLAIFQTDGGLARLGLVLIVFFIGQSVEAYILTPKIMGDRTGLHPMMIIVALFFWGSAFSGILGMILAIPLTAFLVVFWRLAKEKYVRELV